MERVVRYWDAVCGPAEGQRTMRGRGVGRRDCVGVPQDRLVIRPLDSEGAAADRLECAQEFSALLTELKERSGLSYAELGRRTLRRARHCIGTARVLAYPVITML